jgi:hypothetical protein
MSIGGTASRKITGQEIMNASKLNVGSTPIVSGTVGRLLFQGTGNVLQQSSSLFWDSTNNRLGLGTSSPANALDVNGGVKIYNLGGTLANSFTFGVSSGLPSILYNNGSYMIRASSDASEVYIQGINYAVLKTNTQEFVMAPAAFTYLNTGYFAIGTSTNAGYKLDVNGTARMNSIHGGGTSTLLLQSHVGAGAAITVQFDSNQNATSGDRPIISAIGLFNPTSGASTFAGLSFTPTINQTGSANGITRGLYIAPTLTAAADFRAIETTVGKVIFNGDNAANVQAGYNLMLKGGNPRLRIEGGTAGTSLADAVIQFADSAGDNWIIKTNRANGNLVFGLGWNNSVTNIVTLGSTSIQPALGVTGISSSTGTALSVQNSSLSSLLTVLNTGNVLIGTTTDSGFRLDVNGTARVQSNLTIGAGVSGTAYNISIISSLPSTGTRGSIQWNGGGTQIISKRTFAGGNNNVLSFVAGVELITLQDYASGGGYAPNVGINNTNPNQCAVLDVASTTQGFLPPRMTNAQRTAIVSPAVGLIVYCTDVTEGLWVYKSTGWTFIV